MGHWCTMQYGSSADLAGQFMTVTSRGLYAYLTILTGNRAGTNFPLDARRKTLIGRGTDCHISLPDPLCSRVHATLTCTPDGWVIRDAEEPQRHARQRPEDRRSDGRRRQHDPRRLGRVRVSRIRRAAHRQGRRSAAHADDRAGHADRRAGIARRGARRPAQHRAGQGADAALPAVHQAARLRRPEPRGGNRARPVAQADRTPRSSGSCRSTTKAACSQSWSFPATRPIA